MKNYEEIYDNLTETYKGGIEKINRGPKIKLSKPKNYGTRKQNHRTKGGRRVA